MPFIVTTTNRDAAVKEVDGEVGHAVEFCHSPERHRDAYDAAEVVSVRAVATLDERICFNPREWEAAGGDQPDSNIQFYHHVLILSRKDYGDEETAEVLWLHDGSVSRGHFTSVMSVPGGPTGFREGLIQEWNGPLLSESGGSVGPLPDGTTIEVRKATRSGFALYLADHPDAVNASEEEALAAFNAAQEARVSA